MGFDALQEVAQRRFVRGVAGHYLVGQWQAIRRHDQGDDDLDAVGAFVPAVTMPSLAGVGRIALEVSARQIVEQDFELGLEQSLPALLQEAEQNRSCVPAACQGSDTDCPSAPGRSPRPSRFVIPLPMQPPLTAGIDQSVSHQRRLQHVQPACPLSRFRQARRPQRIQLKLIPQMARQPAATPLPRPAKQQAPEPDMHHIAIRWRRCTILGKQRDLFAALPSLVERLDRLAPRGALAVVDLARYSTCRCTVRPPETRRFSTTLQ